jgi:hypothetical protein
VISSTMIVQPACCRAVMAFAIAASVLPLV